MTKKSTTIKADTSLKTFFLYAFIVILIILVSLSIKAFLVIKQNRFDGKKINISVSKNNQVKAIVGIDDTKKTISILKINDYIKDKTSISESIGLFTDANIESTSDLSVKKIDSLFIKSAFKLDGVKTNLTIFDSLWLFLLSKNVSSNSIKEHELNISKPERGVDDKIIDLFSDKNILEESLSVQIVNATNELGLGRKFERIIVNMGGNVVSITSARVKQPKSKIMYFGDSSYTVQKLENILNFKSEKVEDKSVGDIVIIIGEDYKKKIQLD